MGTGMRLKPNHLSPAEIDAYRRVAATHIQEWNALTAGERRARLIAAGVRNVTAIDADAHGALWEPGTMPEPEQLEEWRRKGIEATRHANSAFPKRKKKT